MSFGCAQKCVKISDDRWRVALVWLREGEWARLASTAALGELVEGCTACCHW